MHESIFEQFAQAFAEHAGEVVIGDGFAKDAHIGPLSNAKRVQDIERLVDDARDKGARVLCGGARPERKGFYYPLTVLADVPDEAQVLIEEPFGPIAIINSFTTLDDALSKANALNVGLAAYAFTNDADAMNKLSDGLEAGSFAINTFQASSAETPFGGVKDSGYGREGGAESLDAYSIVKSVMHANYSQVMA
ncbi:Alpha-ketoglutaric semialdehyde dehydrogenase [bioreactor metagenome]|uniref:Alpha-ketoglutaric semialdehyde dehydrogenase n=1 Tax=bioreactor metagenome TaxID=1076179 RepID=A0A645GE50_9ZZZZ